MTPTETTPIRQLILSATLGLLLAVALAATPAAASHPDASLPRLHPDPVVQEAIQLWDAHEDWNVDEEHGCVHHTHNDDCLDDMDANKWIAEALTSAGIDIHAWPSEEASLIDWLLDRSDDTRDEHVRKSNCGEGENEAIDCPAEMVDSLAKSILAFSAAGIDPQAVPLPEDHENDTRDYVEDLLEYHDGGQFGVWVHNDVWALIALNTIGYESQETRESTRHITSTQHPNGGVGWHEDKDEVDTTSAAIQALAPRGHDDFVQDALDYLEQEQIQEGAHRACWGHDGTTSSESTARAIGGLVAAGQDPHAWSIDGQSPLECLLSLRTEDGGFKSNPESSGPSGMSTRQSLKALTWIPYGQATSPTQVLHEHHTTTEDETTITEPPKGFLRIDDDAHTAYEWTPKEPGTRTFHGATLGLAPQPTNVTVEVEPAPDPPEEDDQETGNDNEAPTKEDDPPLDPPKQDDPTRPTASITTNSTAERNVPTTVTVSATPGNAPINAYRVDWGDGNQTPWENRTRFNHTYNTLGEVTLTAHARDEDGHRSDPTQTTVTLEDATPRIDAQIPSTVPRNETIMLHANATDPDGPRPTITWTIPGAKSPTQTGTNVTTRFHEPGPHTIQATVADEAGNQASTKHHVNTTNRGPTNLTVTPTTIPAHTTTVLQANATDPDGDEVTIRWRHENRTTTGPLHVLEVPGPGNETITVNATDAYGLSTQTTIPLNVIPPPPSPPAPQAPAPTQAPPDSPTAQDAGPPTIPIDPAQEQEQASINQSVAPGTPSPRTSPDETPIGLPATITSILVALGLAPRRLIN